MNIVDNPYCRLPCFLQPIIAFHNPMNMLETTDTFIHFRYDDEHTERSEASKPFFRSPPYHDVSMNQPLMALLLLVFM